MLFNEWNLEDALAVEREEGIEIGIERGREAERETVARTALAEGAPVDFIRKITGLDVTTIEQLAAGR